MEQNTTGKMIVSGASATEYARIAYHVVPTHTHFGNESNYRVSRKWIKRQAHKADRRLVNNVVVAQLEETDDYNDEMLADYYNPAFSMDAVLLDEAEEMELLNSKPSWSEIVHQAMSD